MRCYTHLDLNDRRRLYQLINAGRSPRQAAVELGRHPSTIYRELRRNRHLDEEPVFRGYFRLQLRAKLRLNVFAVERSSGGMNSPRMWSTDCEPPGRRSRSPVSGYKSPCSRAVQGRTTIPTDGTTVPLNNAW